MATVVYAPEDHRQERLSQAIWQLGAVASKAYKENKKSKAFSSAMDGLASGELTETQAASAMAKGGMDPEAISAALKDRYEEKRSLRTDTTQRRGQDIQKELGVQGDETQRRGQDLSLTATRESNDVQRESISAANQRSAAEIAARSADLGRQLSHAEKMAIVQHNNSMEELKAQAGFKRDDTVLQGAIQSQLGKENSEQRIKQIVAEGGVSKWLQDDRQEGDAVAAENALEGQIYRDRIAADKESSLQDKRLQGDLALLREGKGLDRIGAAQQHAYNTEDINLRGEQALTQIGAQGDQAIRQIGARGAVEGQLQDDQQQFQSGENDKKIDADIYSQRIAIGAQDRQQERGFAHDTNMLREGAFQRRLAGQSEQIFQAGESDKAREFTAGQNDLTRQSNERIAGLRVDAKGKITGTTQAERDVNYTKDMLSSAAKSIGLEFDPKSESAGFIARSYNKNADDILKDYGKQMGVDAKTRTPDGLMSKLDGSKAGGLDRMKFELGAKLLPSLYVKEASGANPDVTRGNIQSKLMSNVDTMMRDPGSVLPPDLYADGQMKGNPRDTIKYLVETKGFTKEDVKQWSNIVNMPIPPEALEQLYPWSN